MAPLLPLSPDDASGSLEWPIGASMALSELAQGPEVSGVLSGEAMFDCIVDMRRRCGIKRFKLPSKTLEGMEYFFVEFMPQDLCRGFFCSLLPAIAQLALKLPALLKDQARSQLPVQGDALHLRVLAAGQSGMVLLSQELVASILACAFFCLYPSEEREKMKLPDINFQCLFAAVTETRQDSTCHKILCLLNYFDRHRKNTPRGMISFERKVLIIEQEMKDPFLFWSSSSKSLCQILVMEDGTIESGETSTLEVDFANKRLGGGVLGSGCLQEEIRFVINPELIAGRLFLPEMLDNEAIEIIGSERYSRFDGYAASFQFAGDFIDTKTLDAWNRKQTHIIAVDALPFPGERQFDPTLMLREVNKAYCGFRIDRSIQCGGSSGSFRGVATGNWGCGVFGGDHEVKSMIQWLAASQAGRPFVLYYTFKDPRTARLQRIADWILEQQWSVLELWSVLVEYGKQRKITKVGFFDWLLPD